MWLAVESFYYHGITEIKIRSCSAAWPLSRWRCLAGATAAA